MIHECPIFKKSTSIYSIFEKVVEMVKKKFKKVKKVVEMTNCLKQFFASLT